MTRPHKIVFFITAFLVTISCNRQENRESLPAFTEGQEFTVENNRYAQRFRISRRGENSMLEVLDPWQGSEDVSYKYYLLKEGVELPPGATYQVIRVPVKKVICMSTTHIAYIEAIGETGSVAGVSGRNNICNEYIRNHPEIPDIGYEQGLNWEKIIEINPDIVLMYGVKGDVVHYEKKLNELGIKTIYVAEYLEETPLAKLEWIKLIGLLFGKYENACSVFEESDSLYCSLRDKAAEVAERPVVLSGFPWKDTWYAAGGKSYLSTLIRDAGGEYLWSGDTTADVYAFDLEAVCIQAYAADLWINAGTVQSSREIESYDSRLASLPPFKAGKVYSNNLRMNETGGNDYFETGVTEPHLILEDLLYIFHPELNPGHQLKYYRKIE